MDTNIRAIQCVYCGDIATTRDHVIPVSFYPYRKRSSRYHRNDWTVPACHECNISLGDKLLITVPGRAVWLLVRYQTKWRKILSTPFWSTDDVATLSGRFHDRMAAYSSLQRFAYQRLAHLELVVQMDDDYLRS